MSDIEMPLLIVNEAHIYQIPPTSKNKGHTAAMWGDLAKPVFTGKLKVTSIGNQCFVKLFDKATNAEFGQAPVDAYPNGKAVESVTDSSRYFVLRLSQGGQHAFVGLGFTERSEAFDFTVALRDHFKVAERDAAQAAQAATPYVAKHITGGLTGSIKINLKKKGGSTSSSTTTTGGGGLGLAPPPGGLGASFPASQPAAANPFCQPTAAVSNPFATAPAAANPFAPAPDASNPFAAAPDASNPFASAPAPAPASNDPFGSFASAPSTSGSGADPNWVKF